MYYARQSIIAIVDTRTVGLALIQDVAKFQNSYFLQEVTKSYQTNGTILEEISLNIFDHKRSVKQLPSQCRV